MIATREKDQLMLFLGSCLGNPHLSTRGGQRHVSIHLSEEQNADKRNVNELLDRQLSLLPFSTPTV
jgi:hypothetical protein